MIQTFRSVFLETFVKLFKKSNKNKSSNKSASITVNSIFNTIKTCASILFPLITFPYVSRILQPENVGKVNFAQSFVSYFALLAALGISTYAIRRCASVREDKEKLSNLASQFFSINMIMTVVAYLALAVTLLFFRKFDSYRWLIIIESASILLTSLGADWLNSAMEDFKFIAIRSIVFQAIALACMFIFVRNINDYYSFAIISVCSSSGAFVANIFYRRKFCKVRFTFKINWKEHLLPILFLFVMTLSTVIMNNTDVTMLGLIKGDYDVGLYSTANKVSRIISQVVQSLAIVVIPRLSVFFSKGDYENINILLRKVLNFNITFGLPCVIGVQMLAYEIIYVVGGQSYSRAAPILQVLILSFMFSLVGGSFLGNAILIPSGKERYYMLVCIITALCNVALNALLIPPFGAVGAAVSTAFNGLLVFVLLLFNLDKRIKIRDPLSVFIGPIIGCILIVLCCFKCSEISNIWFRVAASVVSSVVVYFITMLILKNELVISFAHKLALRFKKPQSFEKSHMQEMTVRND